MSYIHPRIKLFVSFLILMAAVVGGWGQTVQLLDTFDGPDLDRSRWDESGNPAGSFSLDNQHLTLTGQDIGSYYFYGLQYAADTFAIPTNGEALVFGVDMVKGDRENAMGWVSFSPPANDTFYIFAKDESGVLLAKNNGSFNFFFDTALETLDPIKNENIKLVMSMTGVGSSVFINTQVLDLENGNAVLFERTVEDSSGPDAMVTGSDHRPESLVGQTGSFVIELFHFQIDGEPSEIIFDNPQVSWVAGPSLILKSGDVENTFTLSWTEYPGSTFVLEESPSLSPPSWTMAPSGTNNPVTLPTSESAKYFRLRR